MSKKAQEKKMPPSSLPHSNLKSNRVFVPEVKSNFDAQVSRPASFVSIPFSFAFGIILWIEVWLIVCVIAIGFFVSKDYFGKLENTFNQRGKELALSIGSASTLAYQNRKFDFLAKHLSNIVKQKDPIVQTKPISEIFVLSRQGVILAHSDVTLMTKNSRDPVNEISLKYNNEFFHAGLLINEGQIYTQNYPYPSSDIRKKSSYFLQSFLPEKLDYAVDFSTPIIYHKKSQATVHVVMNRKFIYEFLQKSIDKFAVILGVVIGGGLIIALLIIIAFILRARYLQKLWQNLLNYKWENDAVKQHLNQIGSKIENLEKRSRVVLPKPKNQQVKVVNLPSINDEGRGQDPQDAILLE